MLIENIQLLDGLMTGLMCYQIVIMGNKNAIFGEDFICCGDGFLAMCDHNAGYAKRG